MHSNIWSRTYQPTPIRTMFGRKSEAVLHTIIISKDHSISSTYPSWHIWAFWIITCRLLPNCRNFRRLQFRIICQNFEKKWELYQSLAESKHRAELELQVYGIKLTNIRLDCGGENLLNTVKEFCSDNGIHLETFLHMHPKATVVLKDCFRNIEPATLSYYSHTTYPSTWGLKQSITLTGHAIVSLLLICIMKYQSCFGNLMLELTANHA